MARYVQHYLDSIAELPTTTLSDKVRELIWVLLPSGRCSIEQVAQRLGVDRRTVHRRLASEGETFSAILDAVRSELVTRYIKDSDRPLSVVAEMLGFCGLECPLTLVPRQIRMQLVSLARFPALSYRGVRQQQHSGHNSGRRWRQDVVRS